MLLISLQVLNWLFLASLVRNTSFSGSISLCGSLQACTLWVVTQAKLPNLLPDFSISGVLASCLWQH